MALRSNAIEVACTSILGRLEEDNIPGVKLVGKAGIGKTWLAREICKRATSKEGSCYFALWLSLNKEMDEMSLYEDIASQLSVFLDKEEDEDDDSDEESIQDEKERKNQDLLRLKEQIKLKLDKKRFKGLKGDRKRHLLLVLDDEGCLTSSKKVMTDMYLKDFLTHFKILLTIRKGEGTTNMVKPSDNKLDNHAAREIESHATDESDAYSDGKITSDAIDASPAHSAGEIESIAIEKSPALPAKEEVPEPLTDDMSRTLHDAFTDIYLVVLLESLIKDGLLERLEQAWGKDNGFLKDRIVEMSMGLPAAVVVLAKSLNCIAQKPPLLFFPKQDNVLKIAILSSFPHVSTSDHEDVENAENDRAIFRPNPILHLAYELLKTDGALKSSTVDCFWHSLSFFEHCGCINYQELIAHWILEGYFDPVRSITTAYKEGHDVLMELMNRGFLKIQENNVVMPEVAMKDIIDLRDRGMSSASRIGLAKVIGSDMRKRLGKINQVADIIEGVQGTRKGEKITTVLVSGNRLLQQTPQSFFEKLKDLEVLGLFKPTVDPFVPSLVKLVKLRVLVIRDCDLLKDIEELKTLRELNALEVSGASSLKKISDDFFAAMPDLQSLHLSGLQIKHSPSSISDLEKLRCLIIKDCPLLEDLPNIQELLELEVVDVSGARGLQTCFDNTPGEKKDHSKNKNFHQLTNLQLLDFSESQIERLPMFQDSVDPKKLHSLTRLLLRNCSKLRRLPSLKPLSGLQILDLSGTTSLVKMLEVCFEDKKELRILNLSGTNLSQLPMTIKELSNLNELLLRDCINLEDIPDIHTLTNLEVIDVSGCTKLKKIEGSFVDMHYLREVNLFGTKVMIIPEFLPEEREVKIHCRKRFTQADGRVFEGDKWSDIRAVMMKEISDKASSPGEVVEAEEITEKVSEEKGEIQSIESRARDCTEKGAVSKERLLKVPIDKDIYMRILLSFVSPIPLEVMEISETNDSGDQALSNIDSGDKALTNAEFVSFVDISSTRLSSVFNKINSVKGCWIRMSSDIEELFFEVEEARLGSLRTLSITNIPGMDSISRGGSFKNLKILIIDDCPNIVMLFPDACQLPNSLEILHIKNCEKLEKVFKEGEVSTLITLCLVELPELSSVGAKLPKLAMLVKKNCPKLLAEKEDLRTRGS